MKKDYKIVHVIGNGFDLDLGLKTSYGDYMDSVFFKKYTEEVVYGIDQKTEIRDNLFKYLENKRDLQKWIDIETELLKIATRKRTVTKGGINKQVPNVSTLDVEYTFELLHEALCSYLEDLDYSAVNKDATALKVLKCIIAHPLSKIVTYNYTDIYKLESFVGQINCPIDYVHGNILDRSAILGFQDNVDIDKSFCFMIKSFSPHFSSHNVRRELLDANEIIFFGHSLGVTDYHYFEDLFKRQSRAGEANESLIMRIFTYDEKARRDILFQLRAMNENRTNMIYGLCDFNVYRTKDNLDQKDIDKYLAELRLRIQEAKPAPMRVKIGKL